MNDLETAKTLLAQKQLTLVIVKNGETIFETRTHRISGFLDAVEQLGLKLENASVADKVAGKAVALLCLYAGIAAVYAETLSTKAKHLFEQNGVTHEWRELVDTILDESKSEICPFEKEATRISNPGEAFTKFKALQQKLRACR
jgi:hypothetical protein